MLYIPLVLFITNKNGVVWWCGGVVVIRSPHDPEVPSSNPGKNNTSDFSIRDPLSLPSCDWYRIYLAMWWNSSVGRAADLIYMYLYTLVKSDVTGSIPGVSHIFRIVWIIIPACLIKQPNGTLSRMYVQTYISVK